MKEGALEPRRTFLKKALYMTPLVVTAHIRLSHAQSAYGSGDDPADDPGEDPGGSGGTVDIDTLVGTRGWAADSFR
jgi:hypothetical protein